MTTFERLKKMITKGLYNSEEILEDITEFINLEILTEEQSIELLDLIELHPSTSTNRIEIINNDINILLLKQIEKTTYELQTIRQLVVDFRLTGSINRYQFISLIEAINEAYNLNIVEDEIPEEEIIPPTNKEAE